MIMWCVGETESGHCVVHTVGLCQGGGPITGGRRAGGSILGWESPDITALRVDLDQGVL